MLAMLLEQTGQPLVLREVPEPKPGPRQVLLHVNACAVCRTDLHVCDGELTNSKLPLIPGHEIVGTVIGLGAEVRSLKVGDRVGVPWLGFSCGDCGYCRAGHENLCDSARFTGYQIDGGYAQRTVADERFCFRIPDFYNDVDAAPLLCAGLIGYRSLRMTGDATRLGIFGFGAAAHIVTQAAHFQGRRVYAFTRPGDTKAQEFARSLGVDWAGDSTSPSPEELDAAIIFAPVGSLVPAALKIVRKGGIVVCGGIHMSDIPSMPYSLLWGERTLRSVANLTRRDAEEFLALAPQIPVKTVTEVFPLRDANIALNRLRSGQLTGAAVLVSDFALHDPARERHESNAVLAPNVSATRSKTVLPASRAKAVEPTGQARGRGEATHGYADPMHPGWLDALNSPGTYPHPVSKIEIAQTHLSWVALTGDWAYKLKKPVNFDFVNFTTLELREADCQEELRLNRRTAPDLYDGVIALTSDPSGPRFGGTGAVLEYAVRMRQFPNADLLERRFEKKDLPDDLVERLAEQVAELHGKADRAPCESSFGNPDIIRQSVEECLKPLKHAPLPTDQHAQLEELDLWTTGEWKRLSETFIERKRRNRVRECHGDLHLGNIVYFNGKPTLFDCLEFNPNLRWIDVISDVAFLFMDLFDHQAGPLAWRFLNAWLERTGDFRGLRVLKYYYVYRALVRAKVAALRLKQPELSITEAQRQNQRLHEYIELAADAIRSDPPAIILMHGVSGSGKSFVARHIASALGVIQIRSDIERKRMFAAKSSPADIYSPWLTLMTYKRLQAIAGQIVSAGHSVVVDATFLLREQRSRFIAMAHERDIRVIVVACTAPESVSRKRVEQRRTSGHDPSDADVAVLEKQWTSLEPIEQSESAHIVALNTATQKADVAIQAIQKLLR